MKNVKLCGYFLLFSAAVLISGCESGNDGFMGWEDRGSDYSAVFETGKARTTVNQDIYVAPNTTFEMSRTTRRAPHNIHSYYYDPRLKRYVGISHSGRRYLMDDVDGRFVVTEEDKISIKAGPNAPGRVNQRYSSETDLNKQGIIINK
ncbi:MAG: hypothetical protein ACYTFY_16475 [Planctomycetota bacterium]|jgi:hypothetical protein